MKKFFKALSLILALTLIIGTIPVSAAEDEIPVFSIVDNKKNIKLYLDNAKGQKENGKVCKTKDRTRLTGLVEGFNPATMDIRLVSSDRKIVKTNDDKDKVYGKSIGTATIGIYIYQIADESNPEKLIGTLSLDVIVKKNATAIKYAVTDSEGKNVDLSTKLGVNTPYTVTLSRRGDVDKDGDGKMDIIDTDYRVLTCEDSAVEIVKANKYGTVYTVKFPKAGKYTLDAGAYQSSKYPKMLLLEHIEINVGYDAVAAKQSGLASADVTFETNVTGLTADSFKAYYLVGETKIYPSATQKVEIKDNVATVTFFSNFLEGTEYFVEYEGVLAGSFTTAAITEDSIVAIEIPAQQFEAGAAGCKLEYRLLNADGIDCKSLLGERLHGVLSFELVNADSDTYVTSGTDPVIYIGTADKSYVVKATYTWINNMGDTKTVTGQGNVASVKPAEWVMGTVTGIVTYYPGPFYIVDGKINPDAKNIIYTMDEEIADEGAALQIAVPYTKNGNTVYEGFGVNANVNKYVKYIAESNEPSVVMLATSEPDYEYQQWPLIANKVGTATIIIYGVTADNAKVAIGAIPIEVKAKRVPTTFTVVPNKNMLNMYIGEDADYDFFLDWSDDVLFDVSVKDQYGQEMDGMYFSVTDVNKNDVNIGPRFVKDVDYWWTGWDYVEIIPETDLEVYCSDYEYSLNGYDVTGKPGTLNLKFTLVDYPNLSQTIFINCGYEKDAVGYVLKLTTNKFDTGVKGNTLVQYCDIYLEGRTQSGYSAEEIYPKFVEATPSSKASTGAAGNVEYVFTISKDNKVLKADDLGINFYTDDDWSYISPVVRDDAASGAASKLEKGVYNITAYKISETGTNSVVSVIGTQVLTVTDNQIMPVITKNDNAEKLSVINDETIASAFDVTFDGSKEDIEVRFEYTVNGAGKTAYVAYAYVTIIDYISDLEYGIYGVGNYTIPVKVDTLLRVQ